jgi:hypothetical protein
LTLSGASSNIQTQIDLKAPLANCALTGVPTTPTPINSTNTTQFATTEYVKSVLGDLIDSSPGGLDTLNELAAALNDDPNFSTTMTNLIGTEKSITTYDTETLVQGNHLTGLDTSTH